MAAAAVILVLPAYVLHDVDFSRAVLIAEGVAVAALVMCLAFVMANSPGYPVEMVAPHAGDRTPELAQLDAGVGRDHAERVLWC